MPAARILLVPTAALGLACVTAGSLAAPPVTEPVDVNVSNPVLSVEVANADPIPVNVVSASPQPYKAGFSCSIVSTDCDRTTGPVPTGKRLVLHFASGRIQLIDATVPAAGGYILSVDNVFAAFLPSQGVPRGNRIDFVAHEPLLVFAEEGQTITVRAYITGTDAFAVSNLLLTGYLIDAN